jgi:hypothetical protein
MLLSKQVAMGRDDWSFAGFCQVAPVAKVLPGVQGRAASAPLNFSFHSATGAEASPPHKVGPRDPTAAASVLPAGPHSGPPDASAAGDGPFLLSLLS